MSGAAELEAAARAAMARRDAAATHAALTQLLARHPLHAPGWLAAAQFRLDLGDAGGARQAAERGLALLPGEPAFRLLRLRADILAGAHRAALAEADALASALLTPALRHELGLALMQLDAHAKAEPHLAAAAAAGDARARFNHATVLRFLGRFAEAEATLDALLAVTPADAEAQLLRSGLRRQTASANHIAELERLLPLAADWQQAMQLRYALAKEYDDLGRATDSFRMLAAGAALRRGHLRYDVADDLAAMQAIAATFTAAWFADAAARGGDASAAPIFVFGLPRSGTTLLERMLGRHPEITPLGELNDFPARVVALTRAAGAAPGKRGAIAAAAGLSPAALGAAYLARVRERGVTGRFTDKLPANTLYAGLIAASLPRATLVHVLRHPLANGYGMFRALFRQGYPFSYDLDDLGRYMAGHTRLMAHWRGVLGARLIDVRYEDLVRAPEATLRPLLAAAGLPWSGACLTPEAETRPSTTQSAVQVRAAIDPRMGEAWRVHADALTPLARRLVAEGMTAADLA